VVPLDAMLYPLARTRGSGSRLRDQGLVLILFHSIFERQGEKITLGNMLSILREPAEYSWLEKGGGLATEYHFFSVQACGQCVPTYKNRIIP